MASAALPRPLLSLLQAGVLLAAAANALAAQTEFPFAAGTDSTGRAQAVSDAAGRVLVESPEFPRGLWVDLVDEGGRGLAGIQVEYQGRPDSLVVIWSVDPSGDRQETLLLTRPAGDTLRLTLQAADPPDLPPGLASVDWRIDPGAEELLVLEEGPDPIGREAATAFLQERWQGRTGRVAVQIDSSSALVVDLDHPAPAERVVDYLEDRARSLLDEEIASLVQVFLTPHTFHGGPALLEDSITLTTSFVLVPGSQLERWVLPRLGRAGGPVTLSEASDVTRLILRWRQIVDVSPLAALTNLEELNLRGNEIVDISALGALTNLEWLELTDNDIVDVSPLAGLTSLERLELTSNKIVDVSPLTALTNLETLHLGHNDIVDVSALAALTNLEALRLDFNEIVDVSPLGTLTGLEGLFLRFNEIVDISALGALTNLERLQLTDNEIVDVSSLAALTNLEWLWLTDNEIVDVSPLGTLTNLEGLILGFNEIVDISALGTLTNVETLWLESNEIIDVSSLAFMTGLTKLILDDNEIVDVSPLTGLKSLRWRLSLARNEIVDVGPLASLTNLLILSLESNRIADVGPLAALTYLDGLNLGHNEIVDVSPLAAVYYLGGLNLQHNQIKDISSLVASKAVRRGLALDGNPLSDQAINEQIPALRARGVSVSY